MTPVSPNAPAPAPAQPARDARPDRQGRGGDAGPAAFDSFMRDEQKAPPVRDASAAAREAPKAPSGECPDGGIDAQAQPAANDGAPATGGENRAGPFDAQPALSLLILLGQAAPATAAPAAAVPADPGQGAAVPGQVSMCACEAVPHPAPPAQDDAMAPPSASQPEIAAELDARAFAPRPPGEPEAPARDARARPDLPPNAQTPPLRVDPQAAPASPAGQPQAEVPGQWPPDTWTRQDAGPGGEVSVEPVQLTVTSQGRSMAPAERQAPQALAPPPEDQSQRIAAFDSLGQPRLAPASHLRLSISPGASQRLDVFLRLTGHALDVELGAADRVEEAALKREAPALQASLVESGYEQAKVEVRHAGARDDASWNERSGGSHPGGAGDDKRQGHGRGGHAASKDESHGQRQGGDPRGDKPVRDGLFI